MFRNAFFCTRSKDILSCSVKSLCQIFDDCSNILLMYEMYIFFISSTGGLNWASLRSNSILAFALFMLYLVFSLHVISLVIITPKSLVCWTIGNVLPSMVTLVVNWYLLVKLKHIKLDFLWFNFIFLFLVHWDILSISSWVCRFCLSINPLCTGISLATGAFRL